VAIQIEIAVARSVAACNAVLSTTFLASTSPAERRTLQRIWNRLAPPATS
jgi:hypothetical protein